MSTENNGQTELSGEQSGEAFVQLTNGELDDGVVLADLEGATAAPVETDSDGDEAAEAGPPDEDMQHPEDDSIHVFEGHTAGVFSVAWSPASPDLVATGGADDRAFLWRAGEDAYAENRGAVLELCGHTDTVSSLEFSQNGALLASGGMDGCVRIWSPSTGACLQVLEGPGDAVEWVRWHPRGNVVLAGAADFSVWMWLAQSGACMQVFTGHSGPVTCGDFTRDGRLVVTGGGDGDASLRVWDPKSGECKTSLQGLHFHSAGLTAMALSHDSAAALAGAEDGSVKVVALEAGRVVGTLSGHDEGESVEAVAFLPWLPLAATAALDGKLVVWDVATSTSRAVCQHAEGITRLACHPIQPLVLTGCIDGAVRCWDVRTGACTHTLRGHAEAIQDLALSPDGSLVLSGSEDGSARVFSLLQH